MNLVIDAGNTHIKFAVFRRKRLLHVETSPEAGFSDHIKALFDTYPNISHAIISSVSNLDRWAADVVSVFCKVYVLSPDCKIPIKNSYATPQTLGPDRLALATAAFYHNPKGNTLVIDAGTCITYDMVNDHGEYLGGAISPGLYMRYNALHEFTDRLPLLTPENILDFMEKVEEGSIDKFSLSDVPSFLDQKGFERLLDCIVRSGSDGARFCIRLFLSGQHVPDRYKEVIDRDTKLENELKLTDRSFAYRFVVGSVKKNG